MISLANLKPAKGAIKKKKRIGRGPGSGFGKTAGKGMNGQKSRSGYSRKRGFEGGQMPLVRRIPKRGFTNIFRTEYSVVNLGKIEALGLEEVTLADFYTKRLVTDKNLKIKVLGDGEISKKIKIHAHKFSKSALDKIGKVGGEAIIL
jgi:large subunit ribosomal protein L15